jgi:hypothetical protein
MFHRLASPLSALALVGASVALVACGGSSNSSSTSTGSSSSTGSSGGASGTTATASQQKFAQCLKDNGVTLPNRAGGGGQGGPGGGQGGGNGYGPPRGLGGGGGGGGAAGGKFGKAQQACAKYRPQGAGPGGGGGAGARPRQDIKAYTPYLTCLKDAGLDIKVSDGFNALRNLKQSDPKVQAAFKSCQPKLPQRPSTAPGGTSTTGTT